MNSNGEETFFRLTYRKETLRNNHLFKPDINGKPNTAQP